MKHQPNEEKREKKCADCQFTSASEQSLKTHIKRKHTKQDIEYPKSCELCDYELESYKELK